MSAKIFVAAGFEAVATTSGGVAWALGYPDGEAAPWPEVVAATARIARCVDVPVTADIEAGYGETPNEVGAHVAEIIRAGAVGVNLEDGRRGALRSVDDMAMRLAAARQAGAKEGVPIVLNARCDLFHLERGDDSDRLAATIERCNAYLAAGADCVYPFGVRDPASIAALARAIKGPVNVTGRPGLPDAQALQRLGVARITIASAPTLVVMDSIQKLASEFRSTAAFGALSSRLQRADAQRLFQQKG
jgi:2-methylisocitrate lyase-like PEP mutase family enzyme